MWLDKLIDKYSKKNKKYIFLSPCMYAVGTCAEEILYGLVKAKKNNKKLVLLRLRLPEDIFKFTTSNIYLFRLENEYISNRILIKYFFEIIITIVYFFTRTFSLVLRRFNINLRHDLNFPIIGVNELWREDISKKFDWNDMLAMEWEKSNNLFKFNIQNESESYKNLRNILFNGDKDAWFVCIHVRESGFRNDKGRREYRNNKIENFLPLINEIVKRGGYIVRLGDSSMTRLPKIDKVIDYPFHNSKNSKNDLLLIKNCRFYIGNQSGVWDVANLFSKPTITTDMIQWVHGYPVKHGDIGIYRNIYDASLDRFLSFDEVMNHGWQAMSLEEDFPSRFEPIENTPEQLKSVVVEYFEWLENGVKYTERQKDINQKKLEIGGKVINEYFLTSKNGFDVDSKKYRYACKLTSSSGAMSDNFLSQIEINKN